ncbi:MAG: hypothetical protein ACI82F_002796 [Planctomycetota bacterium]
MSGQDQRESKHPSEDVFELLLPREGEEERSRARRVTTFLRLLVNDGSGHQAEVVGAALLDARAALDAVTRDELVSVLEDLLVHYLSALRGPDSFLELPGAMRGLEAAWGLVIERRELGAPAQSAALAQASGELPGQGTTRAEIPALPRPGEPAQATLRRILLGLKYWGGNAALWAARVAHVLAGPAAAEALLLDLQSSGRADPDGETCIDVAQALAAARLERGRPAIAAAALLGESLGLVARSPSLARLAVWSLALLGREKEAAALAPGFAERGARLPRPLVELLERRVSLTPLFAGKPETAPAAARMQTDFNAIEINRGLFGASVLLWIRLGPAHTPVLGYADLAPDLRQRLESWLEHRDGAAARIGEPEQRLLSAARPVLMQRAGGTLGACVDPKRSLALALVPTLDANGEVRGWMHLECAHALLPSGEQMQRVAEVLAQRVEVRGGVPAPLEQEVDGGARRVAEDSACFGKTGLGSSTNTSAEVLLERRRAVQERLLRIAAQALVAQLDLRLSRRRWRWFDVRHREVRRIGVDAELIPVAEGGAEALATEGSVISRAAQRALAKAVPVVLPEPSCELFSSVAARSSLALPLVVSGRVLAVLALESTRARDLDEDLAGRLQGKLRLQAETWRAARFRAWHRRHFEQDLEVDFSRSAWTPIAADAERLVRLRAPLAILGPAGSGKHVLARWLQFERAPEFPQVCRWQAGLDLEASRELGRRAAPGCLLVEGLGQLSPEFEVAALAAVEEALAGGAQVIGLGTTAPVDGTASALWRRFEPIILRVPALADRRDELPALAKHLLRRATTNEGLAPAELEDGSLALLWRQPWVGNVRALEAFLYKLAVLCVGVSGTTSIGAEDVQQVAERYGECLLARLASRHPRRVDLEAALLVTARKSGVPNRTRAALYMGWDPDTLVRRLVDLGIDQGGAQKTGAVK